MYFRCEFNSVFHLLILAPQRSNLKNDFFKRDQVLKANGLIVRQTFGRGNRLRPGREKIGKICKIRGEKLVFSPQILYIIFR